MNQPGPAVAGIRVAVIGAGVAGRGFASLCLQHGLAVTLEDVLPERLRRAESEFAATLTGDSATSYQAVSSVEDAVRDADLAVDFVPDELESKLEIFSMIDRMAPPRTVLLTPTAVLSISDLASCTYRADRCFALRPAQLAPSAGVVLSHPASPSPAALTLVQAVLAHLGFSVELSEDILPSALTSRSTRGV